MGELRIIMAMKNGVGRCDIAEPIALNEQEFAIAIQLFEERLDKLKESYRRRFISERGLNGK